MWCNNDCVNCNDECEAMELAREILTMRENEKEHAQDEELILESISPVL